MSDRIDERGTTADLTDITVRCECGQFKALSAATRWTTTRSVISIPEPGMKLRNAVEELKPCATFA